MLRGGRYRDKGKGCSRRGEDAERDVKGAVTLWEGERACVERVMSDVGCGGKSGGNWREIMKDV